MSNKENAVENMRVLFRLDRLRELKEQKAAILGQREDLIKKLSVAVFSNPTNLELFDTSKGTKIIHEQADRIRIYAELVFPYPDEAEEQEIRKIVMGLDR